MSKAFILPSILFSATLGLALLVSVYDDIRHVTKNYQHIRLLRKSDERNFSLNMFPNNSELHAHAYTFCKKTSQSYSLCFYKKKNFPLFHYGNLFSTEVSYCEHRATENNPQGMRQNKTCTLQYYILSKTERYVENLYVEELSVSKASSLIIHGELTIDKLILNAPLLLIAVGNIKLSRVEINANNRLEVISIAGNAYIKNSSNDNIACFAKEKCNLEFKAEDFFLIEKVPYNIISRIQL